MLRMAESRRSRSSSYDLHGGSESELRRSSRSKSQTAWPAGHYRQKEAVTEYHIQEKTHEVKRIQTQHEDISVRAADARL